MGLWITDVQTLPEVIESIVVPLYRCTIDNQSNQPTYLGLDMSLPGSRLCIYHLRDNLLKMDMPTTMLKPDTASSDKSIWNGLSRGKFYNNVDNLKRCNELPSFATIYHLKDRKTQNGCSTTQTLSLENECYLADGLAFISAFEEGVGTVTAVAIEELKDSLRVVVAANEGVRLRVQEAHAHIFETLRRCALLGNTLAHSAKVPEFCLIWPRRIVSGVLRQ